ncbi:MAG: DUF4139 domain-containing protein [Polyangiaceae bacterium]|nr:DUF4139 domain-containing protein [Polyangiaceae bacterium]
MRSALFLISALSLSALGCASSLTSHVETNAHLGRVVVYRNGIAYFERTAEVSGGEFELAVPADKVDDFLKSLTVLDAETKQPTPIAYPTRPPVSNTGLITMKIQLKEPGSEDDPKRLLLSYVTEAPSWKPSYRIVLGKDKKVGLEGWAIVDNTSGEDWRDVKLGVGSSSALSFRYDLHSVRNVARETLAPTDLFAQAPPTGMSVFSTPGVLDVVDDETLAQADNFRGAGGGLGLDHDGKGDGERFAREESKPEQPMPVAGTTTASEVTVTGMGRRKPSKDTKKLESAQKEPEEQISAGEYRIQTLATRVANDQGQRYVVEGFASKNDEDRNSAALDRANRLRNQLIAKGVSPDRIDAIANTAIVGDVGGARVITAKGKLAANQEPRDADGVDDDGEPTDQGDLEPIGTSHFESKLPMTVDRGSSAMVSILKTETSGEVVYLYDPESARGSKTHAFKSVRLQNPTESTLETGPVTVFGEGGFVGEGMTEPIPGKSASFVPFALDRQIIVETKDEENESIQKILTAQRGVLSTEMRKHHAQNLVIHNRLAEDTTVYVRHTVPKGYTLTKHPKDVERIGDAHLFRVTVPAGSKLDVTIEEETPIFKTVDIRSTAGMDLVKAFVSSAAAEGAAGDKLKGLVELQKDLGNIEQKIDTQREQMGEYKDRMNELHAQIVTLKAVKTGGSLMKNLEKKLEEVSDKLSAATVQLVALEEQRMISRIKLQDGVAELSLDRAPDEDPKKRPGKVAEK